MKASRYNLKYIIIIQNNTIFFKASIPEEAGTFPPLPATAYIAISIAPTVARFRIKSAALCACPAARITIDLSFFSSLSQDWIYAALLSIVACSIPVSAQRKAAVISAISSSLLYSWLAKAAHSVTPFLPSRDECPVAWPIS